MYVCDAMNENSVSEKCQLKVREMANLKKRHFRVGGGGGGDGGSSVYVPIAAKRRSRSHWCAEIDQARASTCAIFLRPR